LTKGSTFLVKMLAQVIKITGARQHNLLYPLGCDLFDPCPKHTLANNRAYTKLMGCWLFKRLRQPLFHFSPAYEPCIFTARFDRSSELKWKSIL